MASPPRGANCRGSPEVGCLGVTGLPAGLVVTRRTPEFDAASLPAALRRDHRTKPGTWALIHVLEGALAYRTQDPPGEAILTPGNPGLVRPEQPHAVEPLGPVRCFVEFHAAP